MLEMLGYSVISAGDAEQAAAVSRAHKDPIDLLLYRCGLAQNGRP